MPPDIKKAFETRQDNAARRALDDPVKLRMAARIFRQALARNLVDEDGNLIDPESKAAS